MRISDWSSDVCSSDLYGCLHAGRPAKPRPGVGRRRRARVCRGVAAPLRPGLGRRPAVRISAAASQRRFLPTIGDRAMNKTLLSLGIAMVLCTGAARAQVAVFDPANFQENLLTAARTLEQINNQVRQLQNQAQMLANQERDLTGLDFSALQELRTALDDSRRLLDEAQGLSFDVEQARRTFGRLYPDSYGADASAGPMARDAQERWTQAREALRTAAPPPAGRQRGVEGTRVSVDVELGGR